MIQSLSVNWFAILVAAIANMVIGALWYSPLLFGKAWMRASGKSDMKGSGKLYLLNFIASILIAYVLVHAIRYAAGNVPTMSDGLMVSVINWLGFLVAGVLPVYLFEGRNKTLYFLYITYQLISFLVMGAILSSWR